MIVAFAASLLLVSAAQPAPDPYSEPAPEVVENQDPVNGTEDSWTDSQPEDPVEEPVAEQPYPEEPVEEAEEISYPEEPEVCRRIQVQDDFGRQRSRKVCRPRSEW